MGLVLLLFILFFFFFTDTATTEIYTLSLHDALPIFRDSQRRRSFRSGRTRTRKACSAPSHAWRLRNWRGWAWSICRSEEHTSELQSQSNLVCRLLLEKKKKKSKLTKHVHKLHS